MRTTTTKQTTTRQTTTQHKQSTIEPVLEGEIYDVFINGIKSPRTKNVYRHSLLRYMGYLNIAHPGQLLSSQDPKEIQTQIVQYIMSLRKCYLQWDKLEQANNNKD